ncbi:translocase subunit secA, partial [Brachionus plicatilis]
HISIPSLKDERDLNEEQRLHHIRVQMIPRVMLERDLFVRFDSLYENKVKDFLKSTAKPDYRHLQIKSLHNHWAFWLDKISSTIKNVNTTNEQTLKKHALHQLDIFASDIENKLKRKDQGIQALIDEPGELIKLAMHNIQEGNFNEAILNFDHINQKYSPGLTPYSHYYKAIALFASVEKSLVDKTIYNSNDQIKITNSCEKASQGLKLLKKAAFLFELEIENLKSQSVILTDIESNKSIMSTHNDLFTKSNINESLALTVHLMAARIAIGLDLNLDALKQIFKHSILGEDKMKELFELALGNDTLQPFIKKQRFTKKIQIKVHVEKTEQNQRLLEKILSKHSICESTSIDESKIILDNLESDVKFSLEEEEINFSYEIYIQDRVSECMKCLELPNRFKPFKKLLIKAILNESMDLKNASERAKMYELFKQKLDVFCTQRNKIQHFLLTNFSQVHQYPALIQTKKIDTDNLLDLIEKNQRSKLLFFGTSAQQFVRFLSQSKFSFAKSTPFTIRQFKDKIFLSNSVTAEKLTKLDLSFAFKEKADLLRSEIFSLFKKNLLSRTEIEMDQVRQLMHNSDSNCEKLRNILIENGLAKDFFTQVGFKLVNYNIEDIIMCNETIRRLFEPKINAKQKLELKGEDFLKYLRAMGIVKSQRLTLLSKNVNKCDIKRTIEECIGDKVAEFVENAIEQGRVKKRKYLFFNNLDIEVNKFKSFVSHALLSCLSPLKTSTECHIAYTDLIDTFKGMHLPREVGQYKQLGRNMVFSLSNLSVPWSCRMHSVALLGSVQAKIGNFLISRHALRQSCSSKTKLTSAEQIANEVAYVIQSNETISLASLSLCYKMTTILAASVIGIDSFNRQRILLLGAQSTKRVYSHQVQEALKQMQSSTQVETGVWLTNTIFEQTFKSIIFHIESNQEYKERCNYLCKNLVHLGAKNRSEIDILIKEKFDEIELEFNDQLGMKIDHLLSQLLGPIAIQLSDENFENIFLHEPTMIEIVNLVNDIIFGIDKDLRARLVEDTTQTDCNDLLVVVNNRVFESISVKLFNAIFSDNFNKFLNHVLKSASKKNQQVFLEKLNELKKISSSHDQIFEQSLFTHKLDQNKSLIDKQIDEIKLLKNSIFTIEFF